MTDRSAAPLPPPAAPLVGRAREQAALRAALDAALAGRGSLVLLGGEAGSGKTALAEWALAEAEGRGALVLIGRCYDLADTPPYGPWRELFDRVPRDDGLPALPAAVLPRGQGGETLGSLEAIVAGARDYLASLAGRRPLVLLLDDLHWADPASLALLRAVARAIRALPALIVVTYRPAEAASAPPFHALLPTLVREARPARLDLAPLAAEAIRTLVAARYALPDADARRLARYLAQRSDGNAFFLGELLRALEEEGGLVATAAGWRIADLRAARVPALIRQVLDNRLARFGAAERAALARAAVIGQEVLLALWAAVGDTTEEVLLPLIERAVAARVLVADEDGASVRFYHALTREALYAGLMPPRRRAWHRAIGEALVALPAPPPDDVAHHFERAGDPRAAAWLIRAGEQAQAAYAYLTAADRYEAAMRLLDADQATPSARGWLLLRLAWLRFYNDPPLSALRMGEALRLVEAAGDRELAACARFSRGHFLVTGADFPAGLRDIRAGVAALDALAEDEAIWRAALRTLNLPIMEPFRPHGVLTATLAYIGLYAEARVVGERCVALRYPALAGPEGHRADDMQAYLGLGIAYAGLGEPERSRWAFAAARDTLRNSNEYLLSTLVDLYEWLFPVFSYSPDDVAERRRLVASTHRVWDEATGPIADNAYALYGGYWLDFLEGRWTEARPTAQRGIIMPPNRFFQYAALGELDRAGGDVASAWRRVREVHPAGPAAGPGGEPANTALAYQRLAAALALDAGDPDGARAWLEAHDRWLAWSGSVPGRAEGALGWAAYHRAVGDPPGAFDRAAAALALAERPRQPLALLAARRLLGELTTADGRFAEAVEHLDAALALAEACAAPYERALTLLALAELRAAMGDREGARSALAEARAMLEPLAAIPALARADALAARLAPAPGAAPAAPLVAVPGGLSPREVEVLRLVAQGLTDAQVAEQLSLSRRTVSSHLTSIYAKLGVATRTAAAHAAARHGLA